MEPIPVPEAAKMLRPDCRVVKMGPPRDVSDNDCGTAEMLIGGTPLAGFAGRGQYAYYRPSAEELEQLTAGGFLEFCQIGTVVQPFSVAVWPSAEYKPTPPARCSQCAQPTPVCTVCGDSIIYVPTSGFGAAGEWRHREPPRVDVTEHEPQPKVFVA